MNALVDEQRYVSRVPASAESLVCTENLRPDVVVMKSGKDRV